MYSEDYTWHCELLFAGQEEGGSNGRRSRDVDSNFERP
jgi:hypothetical protein